MYGIYLTWDGINANVNDNCSWFYPVTFDQLRLSNSYYQYVSLRGIEKRGENEGGREGGRKGREGG